MSIKNLLFNPQLELINYTLYSPKLEEDTEKKYIIIGDLHGYQNDKEKSANLAEIIREQAPHHIVIAGDIMQGSKWENDTALSNLEDFLDSISKTARVFITLGNHDTFGWNEQNTERRINNFHALGKSDSVYPLFNEGINYDGFYIFGVVPSHYLISCLSIQTSGRAHDLFVKELIEKNIRIQKRDNDIIEIICHNPHLLAQAGKLLHFGPIEYDIADTAHMHGGSIPTILRSGNPDRYLDGGIVERPFTRDPDGKIVFFNPLIYGITNLCSGVVYVTDRVQQELLQLSNGNYYRNIDSRDNKTKWCRIAQEEAIRILNDENLRANVISTGIRKMGCDLFTHRGEVTVVTVKGTKQKIKRRQ